ncbi:MAG: hypothetical protein WA984_04945 [Phormidesmis sp.]
MILPKRLSRYFLGAAVASVLSIACSSGLRDYTQVELKVAIPTAQAAEGSEKITADTLAEVQTVIEARLAQLSFGTAEVKAQAPDQLMVRLPQEIINVQPVVARLIKPGQLTLRSQKPDTEDDLATSIEALQRLLIEQDTRLQTSQQAEASALQPQIDETRAAILDLFEPSELTGDRITTAQAVEVSGFNTWEVRIWLDAEGTEQFAAQTKALAGTGRALGIFLDDVLLSMPTVDVTYAATGITDGEATIAGNFTAEAAEDLEFQLKSGALPAKVEVVRITSSDEPESNEPESDEPESNEPESNEPELNEPKAAEQ